MPCYHFFGATFTLFFNLTRPHGGQYIQGKFMSNKMKRAGGFYGAALLVLLLGGCGGGKTPKTPEPPPPPPPTPQEKVSQLEASGTLPRLDRGPTLAGMDANGDGVRDDIASHIFRKYTDPAQRKAAMQAARAFQTQILVDKGNEMALEEASKAMFRAIRCRSKVFRGEGFEGYQMMDELEAMSANTKDRLKAYLAFSKARSGTVSSMPTGETCE